MPTGFEEIIFPVVNSLKNDWKKFVEKYEINNPEEFLAAAKMPYSSLTNLQIGICTACNFNCPMCFNHFDKEYNYYSDRWLTLDEFKKIVVNNAPINDLVFAVSGEPFLHPKIFEMLDFAKQYVKSFTFSTNGGLLTAEKIDKLDKFPINCIYLSADGGDQDSYEKFRRNGNFDHFCEIAERLGQVFGEKVTIAATVFRENKESLIKMPELLNRLGIKKMVLFRLFEHPGAHKKGVHKLKATEMADFMVKLLDESEKNGVSVGWDTRAVDKKIASIINKRTNGCHASDFSVFKNHCSIPFHGLLLDSEGNYNFCCSLEPIPAKSLTTPASVLYNTDEIKMMRAMNILRKFPATCKKYCGKIDDSSIDVNIDTLRSLIKKEKFDSMNWETVNEFPVGGKVIVAPCGSKTMELLSSDLSEKSDIVSVIDQKFQTISIEPFKFNLLGYESVKELDYNTVIITSGVFWRDILFWFVENDPDWKNKTYIKTDNMTNKIEMLTL